MRNFLVYAAFLIGAVSVILLVLLIVKAPILRFIPSLAAVLPLLGTGLVVVAWGIGERSKFLVWATILNGLVLISAIGLIVNFFHSYHSSAKFK